ncbi:hypothetical protein HQ45_07985 [Porphyromonas crevioricanis]|nr:hypothetical protein [Porphyromonas crevioricanis]KGN88642.1 hypothetical protein HQ45_07985 [Porphyromonas crevioricanis]SJZ96504.1 hypothetical protein SAMN02745203_01420 [Porphyromonas crevioricanis]SQH73754.1 Uncharacterised protein [Porphyromonas crevioricanis]GAD05024.1 hypothetical protein PORCRE_721 [Porphyromonas crevioricanis JCM 15906]GAD08168.1 hypothetical protein PORCAN_1804 [Porphyromonas crevioricanis JCM 13913]
MKRLYPDAYKTIETYRMEALQRVVLGGLPNENRVRSEIKKILTDTAKNRFVYRIEISGWEQSNMDGIRRAEASTVMLWDGVLIETDNTGAIIRIINQNEIAEKWYRMRPQVEKNLTFLENKAEVLASIDNLCIAPEELKTVFEESDMGTLLFPPMYNCLEKPGDSIEQHKSYHDFFGKVSLPIRIITTLKRWDILKDKVTIIREGQLDEPIFDHREMARHFKVLADDLSIKAGKPILRYVETFDLDGYRWITHSGLVFSVEIPNLFHYEKILRLTHLPKGE